MVEFCENCGTMLRGIRCICGAFATEEQIRKMSSKIILEETRTIKRIKSRTISPEHIIDLRKKEEEKEEIAVWKHAQRLLKKY